MYFYSVIFYSLFIFPLFRRKWFFTETLSHIYVKLLVQDRLGRRGLLKMEKKDTISY